MDRDVLMYSNNWPRSSVETHYEEYFKIDTATQRVPEADIALLNDTSPVLDPT